LGGFWVVRWFSKGGVEWGHATGRVSAADKREINREAIQRTRPNAKPESTWHLFRPVKQWPKSVNSIVLRNGELQNALAKILIKY